MRTLVLFTAVSALLALASGPSAAQEIKIGILPYSDATASGANAIGDTLSRLTQAEIVHSTHMEGRVVALPAGLKSEQLDGKKIVELGKADNLDLIVMGTLLQAQTEDSGQNGTGRSLFGQMIGGGLHSAKATVTLQADVYDVPSGKKLDSLRVSQTQSDKKISGNANTTLGSVNSSSSSFQNSTLGKALQKTIAELVKQLDNEKFKQTSRVAGAPASF
jgi:Curli production assembly/transport component CsgG